MTNARGRSFIKIVNMSICTITKRFKNGFFSTYIRLILFNIEYIVFVAKTARAQTRAWTEYSIYSL